MKKYKITWSPTARNDLDNIHYYIEHFLKEKDIANNMINKLLQSISDLDYLPEKYVKVESSHYIAKNIRKMIVCNYIVIYEVGNHIR